MTAYQRFRSARATAIAAPGTGFTPTGPQPFPTPRAPATAEAPKIANPDLVERLRTGNPLDSADEAVYFEGADDGYLTYSSYRYAG